MPSPIEFFTIHVSVRLSDRSAVTQHKINFVKKMLPVGFELTTSRSPVSCSATVLSHYLVVSVNH